MYSMYVCMYKECLHTLSRLMAPRDVVYVVCVGCRAVNNCNLTNPVSNSYIHTYIHSIKFTFGTVFYIYGMASLCMGVVK